MKPPRATLTICRRPGLSPGAVRFEVDCRSSTTGLTHVPRPALPMTDEMLITVAAFAHEERCGQCNLADVFARGDQQMQAVTEELWPKVQGAVISRGRQN